MDRFGILAPAAFEVVRAYLKVANKGVEEEREI